MKQKRVGIWIRVSTTDQAEGESPEHHRKRGEKFAEFKNWQVVEHYDLSGVSGKSVMNHPECKRMMNDIACGHIEALIFSKLGRLARNTRELLDFCDFFREHDADLVSLSENIDTSSPAGRMFYTLLSATAQFERETIAERVKASVPIRAELGKSLGGQAPYGYQWVDKKLVIDETEASIRKLMFELFLQHQRKLKVCKVLTERGYRTRKGAKFSGTTLERLLTDPIAKGMRRTNYTQSLGDNMKWELKPQDQWVFQETPAIVEEELWNAVNDIITKQKASQKPRRTATHLFTGLAYCECGTKMYIPSRNPKYVCNTCKNKIPMDDLEMIFVEKLKTVVFDPHFSSQLVSEQQQNRSDMQSRLDSLLKEQKQTQERLNQLLELQQAGELPKAGFRQHYEPAHEQYEQITTRIPQLQREIQEAQSYEQLGTSAVLDTQDLCTNWNSYSREEKRMVIDLLVERVEVGDKEVSITLRGIVHSGGNDSGTSGTHNSKEGANPPSFNSSQKSHASMPLRIF